MTQDFEFDASKTDVLTDPPSPSSFLALVTTIHLSLAALRNHRAASTGPISSLALISLSLGALPWIFPSPIGLALGLMVHASWFAVCERFSLRPVAANTAARIAVAPTAPVLASGPSAPPARPRPSAPAPEQAARPKGFVQASVLAALSDTPDIKTFRFTRPEGFDFEAGQFVTVRVRVDGKEYARCYSISSGPNVPGYIEISVKRQGVVSNALHATLRPGSQLWVKSPVGAFRYPAGDDRPLVLLAGGIGITPLMSMLRHAVSTDPMRPVTLLYGAHTDQDFAFRDELLVLARRHAQLHVHLAAATGTSLPQVYPGRIDESLVRTTVPDVAHSVVLICGPNPMVEAMKTLLASFQVPPAQIRHEVFQAAIAASGGPAQTASAAPARAVRQAMATHQMQCARAGRSVPVRPGQTLLEAAEDAGIAVASLCRAGVCGTCRVQVSEGDVDCASTALGDDERGQGFVLACVATTRTDCTVDV